jgi:anionic glutamate receptor
MACSVRAHQWRKSSNGWGGGFSIHQSPCLSLCLIAVLLGTFLVQIPDTEAQQVRKRLTMRQREKEILDEILGPKYDTKIRPSPLANSSSGETQVDVNLLLRSVSKIDDFNMEYSVQLLMREEWYDDRLRYEQYRRSSDFPPYLTIPDTSRVWMPDIFFINEKQGHLHNLIKPNAYVRVFPDGQVLYSVRISLVLSCQMYLHFFPMDRQKCSIMMASYGLPTDDLIFNWKSVEPVQLPNLTLPRFSLEDLRTKKYDRVTNTGGYSTLQVDFILRRNFSYYMTQMYCIVEYLIVSPKYSKQILKS